MNSSCRDDVRGGHVVVVGVDLDPLQRTPSELMRVWDEFGRAEAASMDDGRFRVSFVQASWYEDRQRIEGMPCYFVRETKPALRLPRGRFVRALPLRLSALVRGLNPDLVHFNGLGFSRELWVLRAALPRVPIVARAHSTIMPEGWRRWYFRWGTAALDAAIFCALAQGEPFKRRGLLPLALPLFEVIEGSTGFEPGDQRAARAQSGLDGDPCLFWLGNLDTNKDPLMVLDAVSASVELLPKLRLYMAFLQSPLLDPVRRRIATDPALKDRVTLLGQLPHEAIETNLRAADFLVQGSHRESAGFGIIESLACGTTPLVTNIPSFRRITAEGKYGALVPPGDSNALARELVAWSHRDRASLRRAARAHFERELSFSAVGRQLKETYVQVIASKQRPKESIRAARA